MLVKIYIIIDLLGGGKYDLTECVAPVSVYVKCLK